MKRLRESSNASGLTTSALLLCPPLERGVDRHGVAVSQTEIPLQPGHNGAGFYTGLQQALFLGELLKLFRCLACLRFDVVYVGLEWHQTFSLFIRPLREWTPDVCRGAPMKP